jgi:hypothetical protein
MEISTRAMGLWYMESLEGPFWLWNWIKRSKRFDGRTGIEGSDRTIFLTKTASIRVPTRYSQKFKGHVFLSFSGSWRSVLGSCMILLLFILSFIRVPN